MGMSLHDRIESIKKWIDWAKDNKPGDVLELRKVLDKLYKKRQRSEFIYDNHSSQYD